MVTHAVIAKVIFFGLLRYLFHKVPQGLLEEDPAGTIKFSDGHLFCFLDKQY
jgi:hypothetical protein